MVHANLISLPYVCLLLSQEYYLHTLKYMNIYPQRNIVISDRFLNISDGDDCSEVLRILGKNSLIGKKECDLFYPNKARMILNLGII